MTRPPAAGWIDAHAVAKPQYVDALDLAALPTGQTTRLALHLCEDAASRALRLPVLVARGVRPGPVVGITAAVHGNELNGIPIIHRLFQSLDPRQLTGTVIGATIVNLPGYLRFRRDFPDGTDLNHIMPGRSDGNESEQYADRVMNKLVPHFEYLIDLHTASFGRINSLYVRADMRDPTASKMARLVGAEIILHSKGGDGTLRSAAMARGVHAITVEVGDPQVIEESVVRASRIGLRDVIEDLGMLEPDAERATLRAVECDGSYWLYTDTGGILQVAVKVTDRLQRGQVIAELYDPWGQRLRTYRAPEDGIVIGMSTNPVARAGSRILHLGTCAA